MSDTNTNEQKAVGYSGLERYDDKIKTYIQDKIDNSGTGGNITIDNELSDTSENPVQNKVIKAELDKKGTYSKPTDGISKSDLASTVQTSLDKADNALPLSGGTMTGTLIAVEDADVTVSQVRNIYATDTDLTAGTSELPTGTICLVYE